MFVSNVRKFREKTGQHCLTVASHGDMMNTRLKMQNWVLMDNRVRREAGIIREAYDKEHMSLLTCRIADQAEMENFTSKALEAIERGEPVLELLTHPRQWNSPFWVNMKEEIDRILRGVYMRF